MISATSMFAGDFPKSSLEAELMVCGSDAVNQTSAQMTTEEYQAEDMDCFLIPSDCVKAAILQLGIWAVWNRAPHARSS